MDATEYDKIAHQLITFRSKLPLTCDLEYKNASNKAYMMRMSIDLLLKLIDEYAELDDKGWIR
tara:strand:+ start:242 stop:430 length:189 start_codon:yes stop_codon:yes gene_type:complete